MRGATRRSNLRDRHAPLYSARDDTKYVIARSCLPCHCEEQRDEAISEIAALHSIPLAMTPNTSLRGATRRSNLRDRRAPLYSARDDTKYVIARSALLCHCEERPSLSLRGATRRSNLRDRHTPLYSARDDTKYVIARSCLPCHCEEQRDEAISEIAALHSIPLAMTPNTSLRGAASPVIARSNATKQSPRSPRSTLFRSR